MQNSRQEALIHAGAFTEFGLDGHALPATEEGDAGGVAGPLGTQGAVQVCCGGDRGTVYGHDQVASNHNLLVPDEDQLAAGAEASLFGGSAAGELSNQQTLWRGQVQQLGQGWCNLLAHHAEESPVDAPVPEKVRQDVLGRINGNGKADAQIRLAEDGGVDADDFAAGVQQRPATVAGIDG